MRPLCFAAAPVTEKIFMRRDSRRCSFFWLFGIGIGIGIGMTVRVLFYRCDVVVRPKKSASHLGANLATTCKFVAKLKMINDPALMIYKQP